MSAVTERTFDLAVIGGGPAGVTAALRAAELGARVALVERDRPGGTCTDDGCAPTRVLAKAARLARDAEQLADYGLQAPPPTLDFPELLAATQRTVFELHEKKQLVGHLERAGVRLVAGRGAAPTAKASENARAVGMRCVGSRSSACAIASSYAAGTSGRTDRTRGASIVNRFTRIA